MKKYKFAVTGLLALFALSAGGGLLSLGTGYILDLSRQNRLERLKAYALQEKEFQRLSAEHAAWKKLPGELRRFRRERIISMDDFAVFRRDLNSCLADNQFRSANINFQFGSGRNQIRPVAISFTLVGPYRDLKKFIFDMERKPGMQFFQHLALDGRGETVSANFSMEAYIAE